MSLEYFDEVMSRILRTEIECLRNILRTRIESLRNNIEILISRLIPQSTLQRNITFFIWCTYSMFTDPFFLYTPVIKDDKMCFKLDNSLKSGAIAVRSIMDFLFLIISVSEMIHEFRQDSRTSSVSEMIHDFRRYYSYPLLLFLIDKVSPLLIFLFPLLIFLIDLSIVLPLPQVLMILAATQRMRGRKFFFAMNFFFMQHVLKIIRIYTLVKKAKPSFKLHRWARVTFYLSFSHAAHIIGASYYFFALQRKTECWRKACTSHAGCDQVPFYCDNKLGNYTFSNDFCSTNTRNNLTTYDFGIFKDAIQFGVVEETKFGKRFFACYRLSLQILSSFGQDLSLSTNIWENIFVMCITITGVVLFFFLIAKAQSEMSKSEEISDKIEEIDRWQPFARLSKRLQNQVKEHLSSIECRETYRGVDIESLLNNLPEDLTKKIKQELCLDLLRNVDEFRNWSGEQLEKLCGAVKPAVITDRSYIVREGEAIDRMLFVLQGELWSYTRSSNSSSAANSMNYNKLKYFCGEELVGWFKADPPESSSSNDRLPISTRTIQAVTNVEAFVVMADDLKNVVMRQNNATRQSPSYSGGPEAQETTPQPPSSRIFWPFRVGAATTR